jgi:hypothetical protein
MIGKLFKFLTKTVLWAIFIALIIPVGYFAVRMGQPMELPEYKGLTYYQYLEWEKFEQHENWEKNGDAYRAKNPDSGLTEAGCNGTTFALGHGGLFFSTPLAIIMDSVMADKPFDAVHFLPNWWAMFEKEHLVILGAGPNRFPACRIPGAIPDDYALSVGAQLPGMVQE